MIDFIFLFIFFACWGGIILIISRKLFSLSNLDVSKIPKERIAKMKKELLERKIAQEMAGLKKKIVERFRVIYFDFKPRLNKSLLYFKNTIKLIKKKLKFFR